MKKTVAIPVRTNAHHTQFPATPFRLTMSVTRLGVSLLNVVATIESPASHQGTARPEAKNSECSFPFASQKRVLGERDDQGQTHDNPVKRLAASEDPFSSIGVEA